MGQNPTPTMVHPGTIGLNNHLKLLSQFITFLTFLKFIDKSKRYGVSVEKGKIVIE
jgi:hypothetical protein